MNAPVARCRAATRKNGILLNRYDLRFDSCNYIAVQSHGVCAFLDLLPRASAAAAALVRVCLCVKAASFRGQWDKFGRFGNVQSPCFFRYPALVSMDFSNSQVRALLLLGWISKRDRNAELFEFCLPNRRNLSHCGFSLERFFPQGIKFLSFRFNSRFHRSFASSLLSQGISQQLCLGLLVHALETQAYAKLLCGLTGKLI